MNNTSTHQLKKQLMEQYLKVEFISAIFLTVLSPVTVAANTLLLVTVWKNPLGCFRTPTIYFTIGLALVDLLCGLTVEPFFALYYYTKYFQVEEPKLRAILKTLFKVGGGISTVAVSTSFLLVLGLSACQLIAVRYPHSYKKNVTKSKVVAYVIGSSMYFCLFRSFQLIGIDLKTLLKVDVALHTTFISMVLLALHILLYRSLKKQARKRCSKTQQETSFGQTAFVTESPNIRLLKWRPQRNEKRSKSRQLNRKVYFEKQITILAIHLAGILLVSTCCHITVLNILLYKKVESFREEVYINIAVRASDLMLFVKVAVDAFVYAWRLPTYRKAFILTLCSRSEEMVGMV